MKLPRWLTPYVLRFVFRALRRIAAREERTDPGYAAAIRAWVDRHERIFREARA